MYSLYKTSGHWHTRKHGAVKLSESVEAHMFFFLFSFSSVYSKFALQNSGLESSRIILSNSLLRRRRESESLPGRNWGLLRQNFSYPLQLYRPSQLKLLPISHPLMPRPPPVAQEMEKSLLGKVVTNSKPQENSLKPLGNSVKRLSDDIKAALSSENLSR